METPETPSEVNTFEPHPARIYDYFIGGKNHFAADRETAKQVLRRSPAAHLAARENRAFLGRAVRYLAAEAGISQFLDLGTGLPTTANVHEVAQQVNPAARVVYVDNDPLVLAHARPLLTSSPEGRTAYLQADLRDPGAILDNQQTMREAGMAMQKRDSSVFGDLAFSGLELVPPGVVLVSEWRSTELGPRPLPSEVNCYGGVARKP